MMMFLVLKERLRSFYGKYGAFTNGVIKFGYSLMAILMLNQNIGFMTKLKNPFVPLVLARVCAFLPSGAIAFLLAAIMLMHIYTVSVSYTHLSRLSVKRAVPAGVCVIMEAVCFSK